MWPVGLRLKPNADGVYDQDAVRAGIWAKPIEAVSDTDTVVTFDGCGNVMPGRVDKLFSNTTPEFIRLTFTDSRDDLVTTPGHRFLTETGDYMEIGHMLRLGGGTARVVDLDGSVIEATGELIVYSAETAHMFPEAQTKTIAMQGNTVLKEQVEAGWQTYNFEVREHHNYVAGGVRVHNDSILSTLQEGDQLVALNDNLTDMAVIRDDQLVISDGYRLFPGLDTQVEVDLTFDLLPFQGNIEDVMSQIIGANPALASAPTAVVGANNDLIDAVISSGQFNPVPTAEYYGNPLTSAQIAVLLTGSELAVAALFATLINDFGTGPVQTPPTITPTNGADSLDGTANADVITGLGGDDTINAGAGDDTIYGGDGADVINSGTGNDEVFGGNQYDTITTGTGNDTVWGGNGRDVVFLNQGNDVFNDNSQTGVNSHDSVSAGFGNDTLNGGGGNDTLAGSFGDDLVFGGIGDDSIDGGEGDDVLHGEDGDDIIYGLGGNDTLIGGNGNDYLNGLIGDDRVYGGAGNDTIGSSVDNDVINGGADADRFDFLASQNLGNDSILDFENGLDQLAFWVVDYNDLTIQNVTGGVRISWTDGNSGDADGNDTSSVTLDGLDQSQIDQSDFIFL